MVKFKFILFGVPFGESFSECSKEDRAVLGQEYSFGQHGEQLHVVRHSNGNNYYNYLMYPKENESFNDAAGRKGAFFGMSVVLNNQVIADTDKLIKLFKKTYQDYVKDKLIKEYPNGNKRFMVSQLRSKDDIFANYVGKGFMSIMNKNPELNVFHNIKTVPSQMQQSILMQRIQVR